MQKLAKKKNFFSKYLNFSNIGFVKIAFSLSLNIFLNDLNYEESIKCIISYGGDTDTNAAILGGLIGAYLGIEKINKEYIEKIDSFNPFNKSYIQFIQRPEQFIPKYTIDIILNNIITKAPEILEFKKQL